MRTLRRILFRLTGCFRSSRRERDWSAELEEHLQMHIEDNLRTGMNAEEARRQAMLQLGSMDSVKESLRDQASLAWVDTTVRDVRHALRGLRRSPGFAITTVSSLAIGLGASLAIFTIADNLLIRPLPYRDAARLVMVWEANPTIANVERNVASPANFLDWRSQNDVFERLAAVSPVRSAVLVENGRSEEFGSQSVTADFFPLLGVRPLLGRLFTRDEDKPGNSNPPVLISYRLWQSWFGGDEHIAGRKVALNSRPATIIGVLPREFYFLNRQTDLWAPLGLNASADYRKTSGRWLQVAGRLRGGATISQAQSHMAAIAKRLERAYPAFNTNWTVSVESMRDALFPETKTPLLVLVAAVLMLLTVACANAANLLLARYTSRSREVAIRMSLGAGRVRVMRQLLAESLILGVAGGAFGLVLADWAVAGLLRLAPKDLAQSTSIQVDIRMVAFGFGLSVLTGVLFGIAPALVTTGTCLAGRLHGGVAASRSGNALRNWLIGLEVALSVILMAGSSLLLRSLMGLEDVNLGLNPSNVLTFRISLTQPRYLQTPQLRTQFFQRTLDRVVQLPSVRAASAASYLPLDGPGAGTAVTIEGRAPVKPGQDLITLVQTVMPDYFHTLGIQIQSGRDFTPADNLPASPYRFIVNEAFVRKFLRGEQPLGKRISALMDTQNPFGEIIGVAGDVREWWIDREPQPTVYYVHSHLSFPRMTFLVRTDRDAKGMAAAIREVVRDLDPEQPIAEVRTLEDILGEDFSRQRFSAWLVSGFAAVALVLAAVGIYGLLAYAVTARTREFGVRSALGADSKQITGLVLKTAARPVVGGLLAGIASALAFSGLLKALLFGIPPRDPVSFSVIALLFAAVAFIAAVVPARRAARLEPMQALRTD
ncbi:MAG TPA: ABC transporter permease [Bryobacteraceae bacterium]|nr:ABC transporter permease [Bryobacteraceae bacterium]